ncbi:hypothetical protein [Flavobacterium phage FL-1]|nr:hypothetical protein [Flavobacterium phage FL-1]
MKPIPTIKNLYENMSSDLRSKLGLTIDYLKKNFDALTLVISAEIHLIYLYLSDIQDNIFPDKATIADQGGTLERQGMIYMNRGPFPDSIGVFKVSVIGVAGSILRQNLTFKSNEATLNPGQVYILDSEYILIGTGDVIEIRSIGAGVDYNLNVNDNLTITEPVIGVDKTVTVTEVLEQPKAGETTELFRQAILNAIQLEPQGGSRADYRQWSSDAQGVRLVYPYVRDGAPSIIDLYIEATLVDSSDGKGTPTSSIITEVEDVVEMDPDILKPINERGRRPMQADVQVSAITLIPVDIIISGLNDSSTSVQDAIRSSVIDFLYDVRPFISGADLRRNKNDILYAGKVQSVVTESLINGNFFNTLDLQVDGNSVTSYEFNLGNIPYLRNLTFV